MDRIHSFLKFRLHSRIFSFFDDSYKFKISSRLAVPTIQFLRIFSFFDDSYKMQQQEVSRIHCFPFFFFTLRDRELIFYFSPIDVIFIHHRHTHLLFFCRHPYTLSPWYSWRTAVDAVSVIDVIARQIIT